MRIVFGASDPYLNKGVARKFHELFPGSDLFLLPSARLKFGRYSGTGLYS